MLQKEDFLNIDKTEVYVDSEKWNHILSKYSKDEIKKVLSDAIEFYEIPMPMKKITLEEAEKDFINLMKLDTSKMLKSGDIFTKYEYKNQLSQYYIEQINIGNVSSNYFQQYNRFLCDSVGSPSPYRTWHQEKFRLTLLNSLFSLKFKELNSNQMRTAIGLRKYIASQFKPSVAKYLYENFNAKRILDFSSGWGDRLAGFYASKETEFYFGIDPNERLFKGYEEQVKMYKVHAGTKKSIMVNKQAEMINFDDYGDPKFDFIFTSPPYYNVERYTQEENQSWKKYKKLDDWLNKFLYNTLAKAWDQLEDNGILAVNISDVYSNHRVNKICDPMNDFILSLKGARYLGCIGMKMTKRLNTKSGKKDGIFVEPIWLYSKNKKSNKTISMYFEN